MIFRNFKELSARYETLGPGDVFIGSLPAATPKEALLMDLTERGVRCIPSPLARVLSASKTVQAKLLGNSMLPGTRVIYRRADLLEAANACHREGIGPVVTKEDRMHCGHGIHRWDSVEALYNVVSMFPSAFPFVLQPFLGSFKDVRVIVAGDFTEAYVRDNPDGFRKNLASGGSSRPFILPEPMEGFCRQIMARGRFPFAHIDLQVVDEKTWYLSEIALNGGISGAVIDRKVLNQKKQALLEAAAQAY